MLKIVPPPIQAALVIGLMFVLSANPSLGQAPPITGIDKLVSMPVADCDGIALGDLNGDGAVDLLTSSGAEGEVFWFEQGEQPSNWRRHPIYSGATEIEGNDLADFDGDGRLDAISLDQETGEILLHRPADNPRKAWKTTVLQSNRPFLQASLATDVDDDNRPELVYTWEGTEPGAGGVHWLDFESGEGDDSASWTDHTMVIHESAWWLAPRRMDVNGDSTMQEIVFTARNLKGRNAGARPGIFWIEPNSDPTEPWQRHTIDTDLTHPLHVDIGQFSSSERERDFVVGGFEADQLHYYTWTSSWTRHSLNLPVINGKSYSDIWNVKAIPGSKNGPDAMLTVASHSKKSAILLYQYLDGQYRSRVLQRLSYTHPMDDRLLLHDLTGDGQPELLVPDSGGDRLAIFQFERSN